MGHWVIVTVDDPRLNNPLKKVVVIVPWVTGSSVTVDDPRTNETLKWVTGHRSNELMGQCQ